MIPRMLFCAAAAAALAACSTMSDPSVGPEADAARMADAGQMPMSGAAAMTPTDAMGFTAMAGASDLYEIQSSQIALQKSQNADVRRMAQMMIDHHTQTTQTLTAAAQAAGMTPPPPQLTPMQQQMVAELQTADTAGFDRLYVGQQVQAHQMALNLHGTYAQRGDTPQLRTAAQGAVPIVTGHLQEFQRMQGMMR